jgi:hypothetical protein
MDKASAIKILDGTFGGDYDHQRLAKFAMELLNDFTLQQRTFPISSEYYDYVQSAYSLGSYTDMSKKTIDVLGVKLKRTSSRDRARTMQRNFIAKYLTNYSKDAALVAFYGDDDHEDWRFSFVKLEYNISKDEAGKLKVETELTPVKRYSYLVGKNEPNHTCKQQFLELLTRDELPSIDAIENAFSVEKVTKIFFEKYYELYLILNEALEDKIKTNKHMKVEFENKNISTVEFTKRLLGQIVFIYFLQKKGWLGVEKDESGEFKPWGSGPKNFLKKLYKKEIIPYGNFFNDILEPLFYEALAIPRDNDYSTYFRCKIPFLNGGLFEALNNYNWTGLDITLDNEIFENIFSIFDTFNFTVKEDEPLDKEVAVDPEMLGKVFENLLEVTDRKSKGEFYTPREVVHYMCQQALTEYLSTNTFIPKVDIEKFVKVSDLALFDAIRAEESIRKGMTDATKISIPSSIKENYCLLDRLLREIKVVDPAVGSGAFPVGMMNEIVKARTLLTVYYDLSEQEKRTSYSLKRETIENCLYGVDIEPSAVEITKLRFWLSLVVDEQDMRNIQPLPNLDFKIMCGNSLLENFEGIKLFDENIVKQRNESYPFEIKQMDDKINELRAERGLIALGKSSNSSIDVGKQIKQLIRKRDEIARRSKGAKRSLTLDESMNRKVAESQRKIAELKKLQKEFFFACLKNVKTTLRKEVESIEWDLVEESLNQSNNEDAKNRLKQYKENRVKPFFLWKLYFADVFQREKPGFDIVIANPPYVRIHKQESALKGEMKDNFYSAYKDYDIYVLFFEKGLELLREQGVLVYITPDKYLVREYGQRLRELLFKNSILQLFDISRANDVFDAAIYPMISVIKKVPMTHKIKARFANTIKNIHNDFEEMELSQEECAARNLIELIDPKYKNVLDRIYSETLPLSSILNPDQIFCGTPRAKDYHAWSKYITNKSVKNSLKVINCSNLTPYNIDYGKPIRTAGITIGSPRFDNTSGMIARSKWEDFRFVPKILIRGNDTRITAVLDTEGSVFIGVYGIKACGKVRNNYKVLLALLNSSFYQWIFSIQNPSVRIGGGFFSINTPQLFRLPYKTLAKQDQDRIVSKVDSILSITQDEDCPLDNLRQTKINKIMKEIDQVIYSAFNLAPQEIQMIEQHLSPDT